MYPTVVWAKTKTKQKCTKTGCYSVIKVTEIVNKHRGHHIELIKLHTLPCQE